MATTKIQLLLTPEEAEALRFLRQVVGEANEAGEGLYGHEDPDEDEKGKRWVMEGLAVLEALG